MFFHPAIYKVQFKRQFGIGTAKQIKCYFKDITTISAQIRGRRLIKKLGFYGEILLNKTLSN